MSIADIAADSHYQARGMIASVPDATMPDGVAVMPGIVPQFSETPGIITHSGGEMGADNVNVYSELLGLSKEELERLSAEGVI